MTAACFQTVIMLCIDCLTLTAVAWLSQCIRVCRSPTLQGLFKAVEMKSCFFFYTTQLVEYILLDCAETTKQTTNKTQISFLFPDISVYLIYTFVAFIFNCFYWLLRRKMLHFYLPPLISHWWTIVWCSSPADLLQVFLIYCFFFFFFS